MTLISTIAQFKEFVPISGDSTFSRLEPSIKQSEAKEIRGLLGEYEYQALVGDITDGEPVTAKYVGLIPYVRDVLANYAMVRRVGIGNVTIGDLGMQVENFQNSDPAPKWKIIEAKKDLMSFGDEAVDRLLEFLETNAITYTLWAASESFTLADGDLIYNTDQLTDALGQSVNRSLFARLKPHLKRAERSAGKLVSVAQYAVLQTQIKEGTLTAENEVLVDKLRTIIALQAMKVAMPFMSLQIKSDGIYMSVLADSINREVSATLPQIKALQAAYQELLTEDTNHLKHFLISNVEDYPEYEASNAYTAKPVPGPKRPVVNSSDNSWFGV